MARKSGVLLAKKTFYIITNGQQTEQNYFRLLKSKRSVYDVKIVFQNADPIGLVDFALKYIKDANQVWCVFDIDYTHKDKRLIPALKTAKNNDIKIAYSNMAFEVWLISHYEKCDKELNVEKTRKELDRILKTNKASTTYDKTDENLIRKYFIPNYKQAVLNAKIVYQKYVLNYNEKLKKANILPIWDWNSSTTVYKLVEVLKLEE